MSVAIACVPASPVAASSACKITVTGADQNTNTGYLGDGTQYPASPEMRYYLAFEKASVEYGRSYVFGVSDDGTHEFNNYVFPSDGSWTIALYNAADDSSVQTQAVTVS